MGDYNVGWERKDDVLAGKFLVGRGYLTPSQAAWISTMASALAAADTLLLPAGKGRDINLKAMSHVCWEPLRFLAIEVVKQLAPFTETNAEYLHFPNNATY